MRESLLLLKTLLLSTSQFNIFRHSREPKKKRRIVIGIIGRVCFYVILISYSMAVCFGYASVGLVDSIPEMCALSITSLAFLFTVFTTNGYLFRFKEYDMLMALPFEARTVAGCKFLFMYIKSLLWHLSISLAMMIGYGHFAHPSFLAYPVWIIMTLVLPLIPMLAASFVGFLIARATAGFRKTNLLQTVLTMVFIIFCFSIRFIMEALFRDDKVGTTLVKISEMTGKAGSVYLPISWFRQAVTLRGITGGLLLFVGSCGLFALVFFIVGRSYRNINSALMSKAQGKKYRLSGQKSRGVVRAIAFKEFKRMTGSTAYMTNAAMGVILAVLVGVVALVIGFDKIIASIAPGAPLTSYMIQPTIPFISYFFVGMLATTACSPSLEGRNYWIIQSLPIEKKDIFRGKMLFNMILTVPPMILSIILLCISAKAALLDALCYLLLGIALCAFSTCWGCVCGIRHMRLDWENEIEVIKQGAAVTIYLLPNMIAVLGILVLLVILGMRMDHRLLAILMSAIAALLAALCYRRALRLAERT